MSVGATWNKELRQINYNKPHIFHDHGWQSRPTDEKGWKSLSVGPRCDLWDMNDAFKLRRTASQRQASCLSLRIHEFDYLLSIAFHVYNSSSRQTRPNS